MRAFGFGPASCQSTQKEGFLGGGCDSHPNHQRRMTHGEMQHCNTGHKVMQMHIHKKIQEFNFKHKRFQGFDTFNLEGKIFSFTVSLYLLKALKQAVSW